MNLTLRLVATVVLASAIACGGGGGGGGGGGFTDPGHKDSALQAIKLSGMGDSMMQGMDTACDGVTPRLAEDHTACSFAQGDGTDVFSLYQRYKVVSGLSGGEDFVSFSGATMTGDAASQAAQICAQTTKPNRIVILLGANEVCGSSSPGSMPTATAFGDALKAALDQLASVDCGLPSGTRVHVLSVPRVDYLVQAVSGKACKGVLSIACPIVTAYTNIGPLIDGYNGAIKDAVVAANGTYDPTEILFSTDWTDTSAPSIGTHVFSANDVSDVDCFHPSAQGQNMLACAAWESWEGLGNPAACQ